MRRSLPSSLKFYLLFSGFYFVVLADIAGCVSHKSLMDPIIKDFDKGDFSKAQVGIEPLLSEYTLQDLDEDGKPDAPIHGVVFNLDGGNIQQIAGDYKNSIATFQRVYDTIIPYYDSESETRVTEELAAAITNQTARTYRATSYERIMLNTYQALNYFAIDQADKGNIELNRAQKWQDHINYEGYAAKEQAAMLDRFRPSGYDLQSTLKDRNFSMEMKRQYGTLRDMRAYANYEIPYTVYLRAVNGLGIGTQSKLEQSRNDFKHVAEMLSPPSSDLVRKDVEFVDSIIMGTKPQKRLFIFVESGRAPSLKEFRLDIPLGIKEVPYVGAAFPVLEIHDQPSVTGFTVNLENAVHSELLTDMDAVVAHDFNRRLPGIIFATLVSSATKALATYEAQKTGGGYAAIAGAVYQAVVNSADLRCWLTLPKKVLWTRVDRPASGDISIRMSDGQIISVKVPDELVSVLRIRTVNAGTKPSVMIFAIKIGEPIE